MSQHAAFRRTPVPQQFAQSYKAVNFPAPTRGIIEDENEAFMRPGAAQVCDNWLPTMRGVKIRGGSKRWCDLHAGLALTDPARQPIISGFEYQFGNVQRMYVGQLDKLYDVTTTTPVLIKSGQTSGNYAAAQISSAGGNFLTAVNDKGDLPLQFDGTTWTTLSAGQINGPAGPVAVGANLTYIWKYRGRYFFIEANSMNAWYLGIDSHQGLLKKIPLSGTFTKGGKLLFGATWSIDAGDGIDDKCIFMSDQGEVVIFTGSDPGDINSWRQEGRYALSPPLGMNGWASIGGDLIILTVDGIVPLSQAITKTAEQLELAMLSRSIKKTWRDEVNTKRGTYPWSIKKWDEYGAIWVTTPGGAPGKRYCLGANNATVAWMRCVGWDATCFIRLRGDCFFGTQSGLVQQMDRTGLDDAVQQPDGKHTGNSYVATIVGGWETFQTGAAQATWHQARASFTASQEQPFEPQLDACTDYVLTIPPPPPAGLDPGVLDVWDQGLWDVAKWDQPGVARAPVRNTMWRSIGKSGFSHAPIVQVTVSQQATPNVELIVIAALFERGGTNV